MRKLTIAMLSSFMVACATTPTPQITGEVVSIHEDSLDSYWIATPPPDRYMVFQQDGECVQLQLAGKSLEKPFMLHSMMIDSTGKVFESDFQFTDQMSDEEKEMFSPFFLSILNYSSVSYVAAPENPTNTAVRVKQSMGVFPCENDPYKKQATEE